MVDLRLQRPLFSRGALLSGFHQSDAGRVGLEGSLSHFAPALGPRAPFRWVLQDHPGGLLRVRRGLLFTAAVITTDNY